MKRRKSQLHGSVQTIDNKNRDGGGKKHLWSKETTTTKKSKIILSLSFLFRFKKKIKLFSFLYISDQQRADGERLADVRRT